MQGSVTSQESPWVLRCNSLPMVVAIMNYPLLSQAKARDMACGKKRVANEKAPGKCVYNRDELRVCFWYKHKKGGVRKVFTSIRVVVGKCRNIEFDILIFWRFLNFKEEHKKRTICQKGLSNFQIPAALFESLLTLHTLMLLFKSNTLYKSVLKSWETPDLKLQLPCWLYITGG